MSLDAGSAMPVAPKSGWRRLLESRFLPINKLLQTKWMQQVFPKLLWLVIPLQYYYAQQLPAGFNLESYLPSAALVIVMVSSMVCVAGVIAIGYPRSEYYYDSARSLVSSMLGTWAFALALICGSFGLSGWSARPSDVIQDFLCPFEPGPWIRVVCDSRLLRPLLVYLIYALAGAVLLTILIHGCARIKAARNEDYRPLREPNLVVVAIAVAVLMAFFQWLITATNS
ncbi:hypothetical protein [Bradyrhizobium sp. Cp5.3]|uniref:hypothetical protein n=1 Tax=Bradyrhizobium sp. Cp5.3 TaxID=443598 RepID=UPI000486F5A7|nr:hypothetical protein [Bradyrhizobium sp. Cp5.3]